MNPRLQRIQSLLRGAHLLGLFDAVRRWANEAKYFRSNRRFAREHPDFPIPPSSICFDAHGNVDRAWFARSGRERATEVAEHVRHHVEVPRPDILEWGCGGGRIVRHLPDLLATGTVAGSDYNQDTIRWCRANLPGIRFEHNGLEPPLGFDDEAFDFVYAVSVLTHLSEPMQFAWMADLHRVTRPGGAILVTVKGESFRSILLPDELDAWANGELIVRGEVQEGKRMYGAFHPERFMRDRLLVGLDVVEYLPSSNLRTQDTWVVKRGAR